MKYCLYVSVNNIILFILIVLNTVYFFTSSKSIRTVKKNNNKRKKQAVIHVYQSAEKKISRGAHQVKMKIILQIKKRV